MVFLDPLPPCVGCGSVATFLLYWRHLECDTPTPSQHFACDACLREVTELLGRPPEKDAFTLVFERVLPAVPAGESFLPLPPPHSLPDDLPRLYP